MVLAISVGYDRISRMTRRSGYGSWPIWRGDSKAIGGGSSKPGRRESVDSCPRAGSLLSGQIRHMTDLHRCAWAEGDPLMRAYHDEEWGVPEYDSRALWEKLMLDGFQAGLSWLTILRKRDAFREAFKNFDPEKVARFGETDIAKLLANAGIVRSRAKIEATIGGARAYLAMRDAGEDFSTLIWDMVGGSPIRNSGEVLAKTPLSEEISKALKKRGFKFVGPSFSTPG